MFFTTPFHAPDLPALESGSVQIVETFCETPRFEGTCYRASNWIHVGQRLGRVKLDSRHEHNQPVKNVFVKPICADCNPQSQAPQPHLTARFNTYFLTVVEYCSC